MLSEALLDDVIDRHAYNHEHSAGPRVTRVPITQPVLDAQLRVDALQLTATIGWTTPEPDPAEEKLS